jgi:hypothetical protein
MSYGRDFAFWFTVGALSLMLISATLAYFLGLVMGQRLDKDRESKAWTDGFESGSALDDKQRKLETRARVLGR